MHIQLLQPNTPRSQSSLAHDLHSAHARFSAKDLKVNRKVYSITSNWLMYFGDTVTQHVMKGNRLSHPD